MKYTILTWIPAEKPPYALSIGTWDDPEQMQLCGFDSIFDAWAFAVCHGLHDPLHDTPERFRQWTKEPQIEVLPEGQMSLFE